MVERAEWQSGEAEFADTDTAFAFLCIVEQPDREALAQASAGGHTSAPIRGRVGRVEAKADQFLEQFKTGSKELLRYVVLTQQGFVA